MPQKIPNHPICNRLPFLWVLAVLLHCGTLTGQSQPLTACIHFVDSPDTVLPEVGKIHLAKFNSLQEIGKSVANLSLRYQTAGYLLAGADAFTVSGDTCHIRFFRGEVFHHIQVVFSAEDYDFLSSAGYACHNPVPAASAAQCLQQAVFRLNEKGYPLAKIRLTASADSSTTGVFEGTVERGLYYRWDSVDIRGDLQISNRVLQRMLRMKKGESYSRKSFGQVSKNLSMLPYLKLTGNPAIILTDEGLARLVLPLERVRTSSFRGIAGFGPDQADPSRIRLSGDVNLKLVNALRYGEEMVLNWTGIQGDQQLELGYAQPYLPILPFGLYFRMDFLKKGDLYYRLDQRYGLLVPAGPGFNFSLYIRQQESRVLDRSIFTGVPVLPPYTDMTFRSFGAALTLTRLDHLQNPGRGGYLKADLSTGKKTLLSSYDIPETLLAGKPLQQQQGSADLRGDLYIPLTPRWIFHPALMAYALAGQMLLENELFLLGGTGSLRGFEERSLRASSALAFTAEIRYRFEEASHFRLFTDAGWYERNLPASYHRDFPVGFGVGIGFSTAAGILQLDYAYGIQQGNPFDFRTGRLHLGILTTF
ncbi:MAG TPA: BamA/TamA family outer membrane protein [Bacteroidales bacterium]|nr:BamA/TamA family outer membrane protein [Bacteroidales bacterium]